MSVLDTVADKTIDSAHKLISSMPPAFVMLCLINALFLGVYVWFSASQADARDIFTLKIIDVCVKAVPSR